MNKTRLGQLLAKLKANIGTPVKQSFFKITNKDYLTMRIGEEVNNINNGVTDTKAGLKNIMEFAAMGLMKIDLGENQAVPF